MATLEIKEKIQSFAKQKVAKTKNVIRNKYENKT